MVPAGLQPAQEAGAAQEAQEPVHTGLDLGAFIHLEALGPGHHRPPHQLIQQHHQAQHGEDGVDLGPAIALLHRGVHVGPDARQLEVLVAGLEGLGGHEEEPAVGHAHHGVPHQAGGGEGQLHEAQLLEPAEAVEGGGLLQILGEGFEALVEAEGHVPGLAGDDEQHRRQLQAHVAAGEQGEHDQQDRRQEGQQGDALEDVQDGHQDPLSNGILGGPVGHHQGEGEGQGIGGDGADEGEQQVLGQGPGAQGDLHRVALHGGPLQAHVPQRRQGAAHGGEHKEVDPPFVADGGGQEVGRLAPDAVEQAMDHGRSGGEDGAHHGAPLSRSECGCGRAVGCHLSGRRVSTEVRRDQHVVPWNLLSGRWAKASLPHPGGGGQPKEQQSYGLGTA